MPLRQILRPKEALNPGRPTGACPEACLNRPQAFAALNRLMTQSRDPAVATDIIETRAWRRDNLPLWSDSAGSVHAYEGKPDDEPAPNARM
jgi:hypothetical protein